MCLQLQKQSDQELYSVSRTKNVTIGHSSSNKQYKQHNNSIPRHLNLNISVHDWMFDYSRLSRLSVAILFSRTNQGRTEAPSIFPSHTSEATVCIGTVHWACGHGTRQRRSSCLVDRTLESRVAPATSLVACAQSLRWQDWWETVGSASVASFRMSFWWCLLMQRPEQESQLCNSLALSQPQTLVAVLHFG